MLQIRMPCLLDTWLLDTLIVKIGIAFDQAEYLQGEQTDVLATAYRINNASVYTIKLSIFFDILIQKSSFLDNENKYFSDWLNRCFGFPKKKRCVSPVIIQVRKFSAFSRNRY